MYPVWLQGSERTWLKLNIGVKTLKPTDWSIKCVVMINTICHRHWLQMKLRLQFVYSLFPHFWKWQAVKNHAKSQGEDILLFGCEDPVRTGHPPLFPFACGVEDDVAAVRLRWARTGCGGKLNRKKRTWSMSNGARVVLAHVCSCCVSGCNWLGMFCECVASMSLFRVPSGFLLW